MSKITEQLESVTSSFDDGHISVRGFLEHIGSGSVGIALLIVAIPNFVPFANMLGITWILAPVLGMLSIQLMLKLKSPWLPSFVMNKTVDVKKLGNLIEKVLPYLKSVEKLFYQRMPFLFHRLTYFLIGLICFGLSMIMLVPLLPLGDSFPSLLIAGYALSIVQKDGLMLVASVAATCGVLLAFYQVWLSAIQFLIS